MATTFSPTDLQGSQWQLPTSGNTGSYGEGQVSQILSHLNTLKSQVQGGQLNLTDYYDQANKWVQQAAQLTGSISSKGSKAANAVNPLWQQFEQQGFVQNLHGSTKDNPSGWATVMPFSRKEYASLPENVLPTQDDVTKGLWDPAIAPLNRLQSPTTTPTSPGSPSSPSTPSIVQNPSGPAVSRPNPQQGTAGGAPGTGTSMSSPQPQPTDFASPVLKDITTGTPGVSTNSDRGLLESQGEQQAKTLLDVLNQQNDIRKNALTTAGSDYQTQAQSRQQSLKDLASQLATNQTNLFNRAIPDLAEQANTQGILQSTGFGNLLSQKYANLTADTQNQLALKSISDRDTLLGQQAGLTSAGVSNANTYAGGLGDVANTKLGFDTSGLQRQFSLSDYAQQIGDMSKYGLNSAPTVASSSTKGSSALQGGLGGAGVGASVGGPVGAAVGGTLGAIGGGQAAKKA